MCLYLSPHLYSPENCACSPYGKSRACKEADILLANVNNYVEQGEKGSARLNNVPEGCTALLDILTLIPHDISCTAEKGENIVEKMAISKRILYMVTVRVRTLGK